MLGAELRPLESAVPLAGTRVPGGLASTKRWPLQVTLISNFRTFELSNSIKRGRHSDSNQYFRKGYRPHTTATREARAEPGALMIQLNQLTLVDLRPQSMAFCG